VSTVTTTGILVLSFGIDTAPQAFCHLFIALLMIRSSKSVQKSAVQVCHVTTVFIETTQLVLSQFIKLIVVNGELNVVSLCQK